MTLNDLITRLQQLAKEGHGRRIVVTHDTRNVLAQIRNDCVRIGSLDFVSPTQQKMKE